MDEEIFGDLLGVVRTIEEGGLKNSDLREIVKHIFEKAERELTPDQAQRLRRMFPSLRRETAVTYEKDWF